MERKPSSDQTVAVGALEEIPEARRSKSDEVRICLNVSLGKAFGAHSGSPKALCNCGRAILRVKAAALLRRYAADFSLKNQALNRQIAQKIFEIGFW